MRSPLHFRTILAAGAILACLGLPGAGARAEDPGVRLQVRHQYDGCGSLCYLGSVAMALQNDSLPYSQVVRYANPGLLTNSEESLGPGLENLGYSIKVSGVSKARVLELVKMMTPSARTGSVFRGEKDAEAYLVDLLQKGKAPMVTVQQGPLWEDRLVTFRRLKVPIPPNPGRGQHYLVVTGVDAGHFYVNDTAWKGAAGTNMPLRRSSFLTAWSKEGYVIMSPEKVGDPTPEADVLGQALRAARASARELEAMKTRLAAAPGTLSFQDYINLSAGAFRRQVLADWLAAQGHADAAKVYRRTIPYYERIRPDLTNKRASQIVARIQALESEAVKLLPRPARPQQ